MGDVAVRASRTHSGCTVLTVRTAQPRERKNKQLFEKLERVISLADVDERNPIGREEEVLQLLCLADILGDAQDLVAFQVPVGEKCEWCADHGLFLLTWSTRPLGQAKKANSSESFGRLKSVLGIAANELEFIFLVSVVREISTAVTQKEGRWWGKKQQTPFGARTAL